MIIVPIAKDTIETDDGKYRVIEYTNFKAGGPAVYVKVAGTKDIILVYFFDIKSINNTKVEYQHSSKCFHALGKITREYHLPQPDDKIVVLTEEIDDAEDAKQTAEVVGLKLKSKSLGTHKGLLIKDTDGHYFRLKQILDIKPALGGQSFDRDAFLLTYKDYTGA
jgi:hypothetical protein